ncbi:hypothetical protein [Histophilus somni]|uniref:hypothetical protein n=1 Tax=Histophilus somni TaxID=731 RepID=UPI001E53DF5A|nr:hypothetical protein [Histophilus somni]
MFNGKMLKDVLESKNSAKTTDINMHFSIPFTEKFSYEATLGANILKNKYSKNRHPRELGYYFDGGEPNSLDACDEVGKYKNACKYHGIRSNTFQPDGEQRFKTLYFDQTFKYDIYTLKVNANRQIYKYEGRIFPLDPKDRVMFITAQVFTLSTREIQDLMIIILCLSRRIFTRSFRHL